MHDASAMDGERNGGETPADPAAQLPDTLVEPLPALPILGGLNSARTGRLLFGVGIAVGMMAIVFLLMRRTPPLAVLGVMALVMFSVWSIVLIVSQNVARRRRERLYGVHPTPLTRAILDAVQPFDVFKPTSIIDARWKRLLAEVNPPGTPTWRRTVIDRSIAETLVEVPLTGDLLEPESINESDFANRFSAAMFLVFGIQRLMPPVTPEWWWGIFFLGMSVVMTLRIPAVRDRIPILRDILVDVVAGPGWVQDRRGRRWTVENSIALIVLPSTRRRRRGVRVRLIGPDGVRDLRFERADNIDFRLLWERWMHRRPRLDLLADDRHGER